jgi:hypothetical protein
MRPDWRDPKFWHGGLPPAHLVELADCNARRAKPVSARANAAAEQEIEREQRALQKSIDDLRLELAVIKREMLLRRLTAKAYNPNQPRVPKGNEGAGRWTDDQGEAASDRRIRLAGPLPTDDRPDIPHQRPPTSEQRYAYVKTAAKWLARFGGPLSKLAEGAHWLYEYEHDIIANLDPPGTLAELQQAAHERKKGYHKHHIVEKDSAEKDGFSREVINSPDNLARVPAMKHREITGWYQTKNKEFGGESPRDYLRGRSWEVRRRVGLEAMIRFGVLKP